MSRKMFACLLALVMLLECGRSFAAASDRLGEVTAEKVLLAEQIINAHSLHAETFYYVENSTSLKSFATNTYEYTFYELNPYGYAILYDETMTLMEACYEKGAVTPIVVNSSDLVFYAGPGNYYAYDGTSLKNTIDGSVLDSVQERKLAASETEAQNYLREGSVSNAITDAGTVSPNASVVPSSGIITKYAYGSYFRDLNESEHGKNTEGTCTVIAIQMLLGCYDTYICDQYVASAYESGDGTSEAFHQLLNGYVYGSLPQGGIFIHDAAAGINSYLSSRKITARLISEYSSAEKAKNKIYSTVCSGKPVVASMSTGLGAKYNHSVLVYGVQYDPQLLNSDTEMTFIVHMGWGDTYNAKVTSAIWYYECGYMSHNTHSYGIWKPNGTATHKQTCPCGAGKTESHAGYWSSSTKKCSRCGYVGSISEAASVQYPQ